MKNEGGTRSDDRRQTASEEGKRDGIRNTMGL